MENVLSAGSIEQILSGQNPQAPVLQIIGYKPMTPNQMDIDSNPTGEMRYRLMIGDGTKTHQYCVVTNQDIVEDIRTGRLEKWSVVKVTQYQTADYGERLLIYILNIELIKKGSEVGTKLTVNQSVQPQQLQQRIPEPQQPQQPQIQQNSHDLTQPSPYPMGNMISDMSRTPRSMKNSHDNQTINIGDLTPYIGKWVVKGRVTSKSGIREYNNAKGGGKLFSFTLADQSGEIKVTGFNTDCERYYPFVEPNKVYLLGRASVKNADKRYTTADFEITLNNDSLLELSDNPQDDRAIPLAKFNFAGIGSLADLPVNQPVDLIGAITEVGDFSTIISKTKNKELKKRNVTIVDMSRHSISVTIWGDQAETFVGQEGDIFVTKAARIGNYGGKSASAGDCIFINPDIPETRKIKNWYRNLNEKNFTALTANQEQGGGGDQWKTLDQMLSMDYVKAQQSSGIASGLYGKCRAILVAVGRNPVYKCCPNGGCGKKLIDTQNGELKCDKCQQTYSTYKYRYKTDVEISDYTTSSWVTLWDEKAETILRMKPEELERYMKMDNKELYDKIITRPNFKQFTFTLRSRLDTYNNEERVKLHVISMTPFEPTSLSKKVMDDIKTFSSNPV